MFDPEEDETESEVSYEDSVSDYYPANHAPVQRSEVGTARDFADKTSQVLENPEFFNSPFAEQHKKISDIYYSQKWDSEAQELIKQSYQDLWDAADEDQRPSMQEYAGLPPFVESNEDPKTVLDEWKSNVIADLILAGISPITFGKKLDEYLDDQIKTETEAHTVRNKSTARYIADTAANYIRDIGKGAVSSITQPIAGGQRLLGFEEAADIAESTPDAIFGTPANDYLYETDKDGYVVFNDDGTPKTKWQSTIAQGIGQAGAMLATGGYVAAKAGMNAAKTYSLSNATLSITGSTFKTVKEATGDDAKAYTAALMSLPAVGIEYLADASIISKFMSPSYKVLSDFNKMKLLGRTMAINAIKEGSSEGASDVLQQAAEISQTGTKFNPERTAQSAIAGAVAGGVVTGGVEYLHFKNLKNSIHKDQAIKSMQDLQNSFANETVLDLPPDVYTKEDLDVMGMEIIENPNGPSRLVKKVTPLSPLEGTPNNFNPLMDVVNNTPTPSDLSALYTERGILAAKENVTEDELNRLTELNKILTASEDNSYINSIKAEEAKVAEALKQDPGLMPNVRYEESTKKWVDTTSGLRFDYLKDLTNPTKQSIFKDDLSNPQNLSIVDEDTLVEPDEAAFTQELDTIATTRDTIKTEIEGINAAIAENEAEGKKALKENKVIENLTKQITDVDTEINALPQEEEAVSDEVIKTAESNQEKLSKIQNDLLRLRDQKRLATQRADKRALDIQIKAMQSQEADLRIALNETKNDVAEARKRIKALEKNAAKREKLLQKKQNLEKELNNRTPIDINTISDARTQLETDRTNKENQLRSIAEDIAKKKESFKENQAIFQIKKSQIGKVAKKGLGALITKGDKSQIVIPSGIPLDVKEEVLAHEVGHVTAKNLELPANVKESIKNDLEKVSDLADEDVTADEVADMVLLPKVKRATKIPENTSFKKLDKESREALISEREYLANQIAAEILRRQGKPVEGLKINEDLQKFLRELKLPDLQALLNPKTETSETVTPSQNESVSVAAENQEINIEDPKYARPSDMRNPRDNPPPRPPDNNEGDIGNRGGQSETAWSKRVRKHIPEAAARLLEATNIEEGQRRAAEATTKDIEAALALPEGMVDPKTRVYLLNELMKRRQQAFDADSSKENYENFLIANQLRSDAGRTAGQVLRILRESASEGTFPEYIASLKRAFKKYGNTDVEFTEFALKELKAIQKQIKRLPKDSVTRADLENEAAIIALNQAGMTFPQFVVSYIRSNLLSGLGTQFVNAVGGFFLGPVLTAVRNPTQIPLAIKLLKKGLPLAAAEARRTLRGKNANILFDNLADPSPLLIQDKSTRLRSAASFYNRQALKLARLMNAADAWNRSLSRTMFIGQERYLQLKKEIGNKPQEFSAAVSKLLLPQSDIDSAVDAAYKEAKDAGVNISADDAYVRAFELLSDDLADEALIDTAKDWVDLQSLRGELSNPLLNWLDKGLDGALASDPLGQLITTSIVPFGRSLLRLIDRSFDAPFIPGRAQLSPFIRGKLSNLTGHIDVDAMSPELQKKMQDGTITQKELAPYQKYRRNEAQLKSLQATQKIGAAITTAVLAGVLNGLLDLTADEEQVIDRSDDDKDSKGKAAKSSEQRDEYKAAGNVPYWIGFKNSNVGFIYKDIPVLNGLLFGVAKAKKKLDEGGSITEASIDYYKNSLGYYFVGGSSLSNPYKKAWEELTTSKEGVTTEERLQNTIESLAKSFKNQVIPGSAALRDIKRLYDDTPEESYQEFYQSIFKDIPGMAEALGALPEVDHFGEIVREPLFDDTTGVNLNRIPGLGRIIQRRNRGSDPITNRMMDLGVGVPYPDLKIKFNKGDFTSTGVDKEKYLYTRSEKVAKAYNDVFTPQERFDFQVATGPRIKSAVTRILSSGAPAETIQKQITEQTLAIRKDAKKRFIRTGKF